MASIDSEPDKLAQGLLNILKDNAASLGVEIDTVGVAGAVSSLLTNAVPIVNQPPDKGGDSSALPVASTKAILLVDEYDFPILENINDPDAVITIRKILHKFYSAVKANEKRLRMVFITGITKFSQLSVFSSLNNVTDITLNPKYAAICGFTMEEIFKYYMPHLQAAYDTLTESGFFGPGTDVDSLKSPIQSWYDGYSWDGATRVLNPYSVLNFLQKQSFSNYWFNTGRPTFINDLRLDRENYFDLFSDAGSIAGELPVQDVEDISPTALLFQAGYLTVGSKSMSGAMDIYNLTVPNSEVGKSAAKELLLEYAVLPPAKTRHLKLLELPKKYSPLYDAFCARDEKTAAILLSSFYAEIPFNLHISLESFYHALLFAFLSAVESSTRPEVISDKGIADMTVITLDGDIQVIEIKYLNTGSVDGQTGPPEDSEAALKAARHNSAINRAFTQIKERGYSRPYHGRGRKVFDVAVSIRGTSDVSISFKEASPPNPSGEGLPEPSGGPPDGEGLR
jgi:hypothetical protein